MNNRKDILNAILATKDADEKTAYKALKKAAKQYHLWQKYTPEQDEKGHNLLDVAIDNENVGAVKWLCKPSHHKYVKEKDKFLTESFVVYHGLYHAIEKYANDLQDFKPASTNNRKIAIIEEMLKSEKLSFQMAVEAMKHNNLYVLGRFLQNYYLDIVKEKRQALDACRGFSDYKQRREYDEEKNNLNVIIWYALVTKNKALLEMIPKQIDCRVDDYSMIGLVYIKIIPGLLPEPYRREDWIPYCIENNLLDFIPIIISWRSCEHFYLLRFTKSMLTYLSENRTADEKQRAFKIFHSCLRNENYAPRCLLWEAVEAILTHQSPNYTENDKRQLLSIITDFYQVGYDYVFGRKRWGVMIQEIFDLINNHGNNIVYLAIFLKNIKARLFKKESWFDDRDNGYIKICYGINLNTKTINFIELILLLELISDPKKDAAVLEKALKRFSLMPAEEMFKAANKLLVNNMITQQNFDEFIELTCPVVNFHTFPELDKVTNKSSLKMEKKWEEKPIMSNDFVLFPHTLKRENSNTIAPVCNSSSPAP